MKPDIVVVEHGGSLAAHLVAEEVAKLKMNVVVATSPFEPEPIPIRNFNIPMRTEIVKTGKEKRRERRKRERKK